MKISRIFRAITSGGIKIHTGQWAEDVLIRKLFGNLKDGHYLDLGAYHPFIHSNTAGLWLIGWSGINVDANPNSIRMFNKIRDGDVNIWGAVLPSDQIKDSREITLSIPDIQDNKHGISAKGSCHPGIVQERGMSTTITVPAYSVSEILDKSTSKKIDYLNIDIEGMDEAILKEFDFSKYRPYIVSCEDYANNINEIVSSRITTYMTSNGYELISRAGPTSIFKKSGM